MSPRVTLKDVARETGYTVATVSRALSGKDQIAEQTRKTIRAAAKRMAYQPDPALARLAAWRWNSGPAKDDGTTLALVTDCQTSPMPWHCEQRMEGVRHRSSALGYHVDFLNIHDFNGNSQRLAKVLKARSIRGLLIERVFHPGSYDGFPWEQFSSIGCGLGLEKLPIPTVCNDLHESIRLLWRHARERGYRRVGVIMNFGTKPDAYYRVLSAVKIEQSEGELWEDEAVVPPLISRWSFDRHDISAKYRQWQKRYRPDAIFLGFQLYESFQKLALPQPKGVACYDAISSQTTNVTRTTQSLQATGALAVELCHLNLQLPTWHGMHRSTIHLIEPEWEEGETLSHCDL